MSTLTQYGELLKLTQDYLLQEYKPEQRIYAESSSYEYFRQQAVKNKGNASSQKPPQHVATPSAPLPPRLAQPSPKVATKPSEQAQALPAPIPSVAASKQTPTLPKETLKPEIPEKKTDESKVFTLEPLGKNSPPQFIELRKLAEDVVPHFKFLPEIPSDSHVHLPIESSPKTSATVAILSFDEPLKQQALLANLAQALEVYGQRLEIIKASKMESGNGWSQLLQASSLRLIIASSHFMDSCPHLHKHYRESAKQAKHYLGDKPLLLLSDISFYLKEPKLKLSLWEAIKALLR